MPIFPSKATMAIYGIAILLCTNLAFASDEPPVLGDYSNVIEGTESGEQLYNFGNVSDHLIGLGGDDQLFGFGGNDKLEGGTGNDYLDGGDGNDVQLGGEGNDQLGGDAGNDWLSGGLGNDKYVFGLNSGQDTINNSGSDGTDWLIFKDGYSSEKLSYFRVENNLEIRVLDSSNKIIIEKWFESSTYEVAYIQPDGEYGIPASTISQQAIVEDGGSGGGDTGGEDNDSGTGGVNTTYEPPITGSYSNVRVGTVNAEQLYIGHGSDKLEGLAGNDQLFGLGGNDWLEGGSGDDYLDGGGGNDVQLGGDGNDQLGGDAGDDWLRGGAGSDIYVVRPDNGKDAIDNSTSDGTDWIIFTDTLTTDLLNYYKVDDNLEIRVSGTSQVVTILGWFLGANYQVDYVQPAGGTGISANQISQMAIDDSSGGDERVLTITSEPILVATEEVLYEYQLTVDSTASFEMLTFQLDISPAGLSLNADTGLISWTPEPTQVGNHTVKLTIHDGSGLTDTQEFLIEVEARTYPPIITSQPVGSVSSPYTYSYAIEVTDQDQMGGFGYDLLVAPDSMEISGEGEITWETLPSDVGQHTIKVQVTDDTNLTAEQEFIVTVKENEAPVVVSEHLTHAEIDKEYRYEVLAEDVDGDEVFFDLEHSPTGMSINSLGVITWSPTLSDIGVVSIGIRVTDTNNLSSVSSFNLEITYPDSDKDGIYDQYDNCANSYAAENVDENGCSEAQLANSLVNNSSMIPKTNVGTIINDFDDGYYRHGTQRIYKRDNSLDIVVDLKNNLTWMDIPENKNSVLQRASAYGFCESSTHAGIEDWRLPNPWELLYLLDYQHDRMPLEAKIDEAFRYVEPAIYWSSSLNDRYNNGGEKLWLVDVVGFSDATLYGNYQGEVSKSHHVRCVSGSEQFDHRIPKESFEHYLDNTHRLMWQGDFSSDLKMNLGEAIEYCQGLTNLGFDDWRLPNVNELYSTFLHGNIDRVYSWGISTHYYWSSTPVIGSTSASYVMGEERGVLQQTQTRNNLSDSSSAICVRDALAPEPVVNAEQEVTFGDTLLLDASQSVGKEGQIVTFQWLPKLGDGYGNTLSYQESFYLDSTELSFGENTLVLRLIDEFGVRTEKDFNVTLIDVANNQPPVAEAGEDITVRTYHRDNPVQAQDVYFDGSASSDDYGIVSYKWYIDGVLESTSATFTKKRVYVGSYEVKLVVTDFQGLSSEDTIALSVLDHTAIADAGPDQVVYVGQPITLDGTNSYVPYPSRAYWIVNGTRNHSPNPYIYEVQYLDVGEYEFTLEVVDGGETVTDSLKVTVLYTEPVAVAGEDREINEWSGGYVTAENSYGQKNLTYRWYYNDIIVSSRAQFYLNSLEDYQTNGIPVGEYTLRLEVEDEQGNISTDSITLTSTINPPEPEIGLENEVQAQKYLYLSANKTKLYGPYESHTFEWIVDSNVIAEGLTVNAVGLIPVGTHEVILRITDRHGNIGEDSYTLEVTNSDPVANAGEDLTVQFNESFLLDGSNTVTHGDNVSYEWTLNGEYVSSDAIYSYTEQLKPGNYEFTLKVIDEFQAKSEDQVIVTINPFTTDSFSQCIMPSPDPNPVFNDIYPDENIEWVGQNFTDVLEIERAFNYARFIDRSVERYLNMPSQTQWDSWSIQQQGLYLINAEREARGLLPVEGASSEIASVAQSFAQHLLDNGVLGHHRVDDGASPQQRLQENENIAGDFVSSGENGFAFPDTVQEFGETAFIVNAIYGWIYADKNPYIGSSWGHRDGVLYNDFVEDSDEPLKEGVLGFGIASGPYTFNDYGQGTVVVHKFVDPSDSWNHSNTIKISTEQAHLCNNYIDIPLASIDEDLSSLTSIVLAPQNSVIPLDSNVVLKATGYLSNGSTVDLTESANLIADSYSYVEVSNGVLTPIRLGTAYIFASYNGIESNPVTVNIVSEVNKENLIGTYAEDYLEYIPENANLRQYNPKAFSIFTGTVKNINGLPVSGVQVSFNNQPQYGSVLTDVNGKFILAGEAGKRTVAFSKDNHLTVHRSVISASNSWALVEDVTLLESDSKTTFVDLTSSLPVVHKSTVVSDEWGNRSTTLVFNDITQATITNSNGSSRTVDNFLVQATEYVTPASMPANLPDETAFTYCSEFQVPNVADNESISFSRPVVIYVDNFLDFPVGEIVPVGYYDRVEEVWKPSPNGVVVKLLDENSDGKVDGLDVTGDDQPDDLNNNGSTTDEVVGIENYPVGATYWRGETTHFTPIDLNWSANTDGTRPENIDAEENKEDPDDNECAAVSSYIKPKSLEFHEDIEITGTGLTLHYASQRTHGYHHRISANVSNGDIPAGVTEMIAVLEIGGNRFEQSFAPGVLRDVEFVWDGKDPAGNLIKGVVRGQINIGYKYAAEYFSNGNVATSGQSLNSFPNAWATMGTEGAGVQAREDIIRWTSSPVTVLSSPESHFGNGWSISNHHLSTPYDMIYLGNGNAEYVSKASNVLKTGITQSDYFGDDGSYQKGGKDISYRIDTSGVLIDEVTGLNWQYRVDNAARFIHKSDARNYCSNLTLGNNNQQWRLPTSKERSYAVDKSARENGHIIFDTADIWLQNAINTVASPLQAVCVAGNVLDDTTVEGLERNHTDEVVIDKSNGLMWQDSVDNVSLTMPWEQAIDYCGASTHAGFDDWRLPNINELSYALPNSVFVNQTLLSFPDGEYWSPGVHFREPYWSSTPAASSPGQHAWAIESQALAYHGYEKANESYNVRCVRDDSTRQRSPYVFDQYGKHIKTIDLASGITLTTFEYSADDKLVAIVDQFGNTITINRDVNGKATEIVSPDGYATKLTIDDNYDLVNAEYDDGSSYSFSYQNSLMVEEIDLRGNIFTRSFDETGQIQYSEDPEGGRWDFHSTFDEFSKTLSYGFSTAENNNYQSSLSKLDNGNKEIITTFADGSIKAKTIQANRLQETLDISGTYSVIENAIDDKTQLPIPHIITTSMPSGLTGTTQIDKTYGENGTDTSKVTVSVTNNGKTSVVYNDLTTGDKLVTSAAGRTAHYNYNPATQQLLSAETSGLQNVDYQYDARGRLITITSGDRISNYTFDDALSKGGLTSFTDAENYTTSFEYDVMGRLIQTTYPDGSVLAQSYDANGNLASLTPPGQPTHYFNYNGVNNETEYAPPEVTGIATPATNYSYDRDRKLTSITRPDGQELIFNYRNNTNQLASLDIPLGRYSYSYDADGNVVNIVAPDRGQIAYVYDGSLLLSESLTGQVEGVVSQSYNNDFVMAQQCVNGGDCVAYQYDLDNKLIQSGDVTISRATQQAGIMTGSQLHNIVMTRTHNEFAEVDTETVQYNSTSLLSANYTRDKLARITQRTLTLEGVSQTDQYTYDDNGRLQVVVSAGKTTTYAYDDNGNRLTKTTEQGASVDSLAGTYDEQDRLTSYGGCTYQYTDNGELTKKVCGTETTNFSYDVLGNLRQVILPNATTIEYVIDGQDRRIGKKVNGNLQQGFLYGDQLNPIAELDEQNNLVSRFVYATQGNVPDYMIKGAQTYKIITDHLGSPRLVVNANTGAVAQRLSYDEFGQILQNTNPGFQPFGFAGGLYDQETGLTRFGRRDYDAYTGRWTSKDPIRFAGGDSNLYGYVLGDPINLIDPTGEVGLLNSLIDAALEVAIQVVIEGRSLDCVDWTQVAQNAALAGLSGGGSTLNKLKRLCFAKGTPVHTKDGIKAIEDIKVGDLVASKSDVTGETTFKPVAQLFLNKDKTLLNISFSDVEGNIETLGVTPEHPFWVKDQRWVDAGKLKIGDEIVNIDGSLLVVSAIETVSGLHDTYNFEVTDFHTYFVGESGAWVHNTCRAKKPNTVERITNPEQAPVIPADWISKPGRNGGEIYYPAGTNPANGEHIRVMPPGSSPVKGYENGYWRWQNSNKQPMNPATGKPGKGRGDTHIPLPKNSLPPTRR